LKTNRGKNGTATKSHDLAPAKDKKEGVGKGEKKHRNRKAISQKNRGKDENPTRKMVTRAGAKI